MSTEKQTFSAGQMLNIGGALLKAGSTLTGHDGKQVILQKQGNQQQIVTLVKTSQGMQVSNNVFYIFKQLLINLKKNWGLKIWI